MNRLPSAPTVMLAADPRTALTVNLSRLNERDQRFAHSLLSKPHPTDNQLHWMGVLVERATAPAATPTPAATVENVTGIVALIDRGASRLKHPAILFASGDQTLRISLAGERSQHPGTINVTSADKRYTDRTFFGRIHRDGRWEKGGQVDAQTSTAILAALQALAEDPAGTAAAFGRRTGCCCFCEIGLTDPVSIEVGYGPICAKNYSLPHRATGLRKAA